MTTQNNTPTAEELAFEKEATAEAKAEEIRAKIITEYGFDEEADKERIDKLVTKDMEQRKKLSDAIGQKIKYRDQATKNPADENNGSGEGKKEAGKSDDLSTADVMTIMQNQVHQDDVDQVRKFAKMEGISIAEALKSPIVQGIIATATAHRATAKATGTGNTRSTGKTDGASIVAGIKEKGEDAVPEKGSPEAMELFKQRHPNFKG